jgi:hypothetical protein
MVRFHHFFYLEVRLRPNALWTLRESCCRSCAPRLQVPYQPGLPRKFLNQKCERLRMLKNARIWSLGAALMRALGAVASTQHTPRMMRIFFWGDTEHKFALKSSHPRMRGGFRQSRTVPSGEQWEKSERRAKPIEPVVVRAAR